MFAAYPGFLIVGNSLWGIFFFKDIDIWELDMLFKLTMATSANNENIFDNFGI